MLKINSKDMSSTSLFYIETLLLSGIHDRIPIELYNLGCNQAFEEEDTSVNIAVLQLIMKELRIETPEREKYLKAFLMGYLDGFKISFLSSKN